MICLHCGIESTSDFCCPGCEAAYAAIQGMGLGEYYRRKEGPGIPAFSLPASDPFAGPSARDRFVRPTGDGAECVEFLLEGVTCSACAWLVERVPQAAPEIHRADFELGRSSVRVVFRKGTPLPEVASVFRRLGFRVRPGDDPEILRSRRRELRVWFLRASVALACSMASMHVAVSLYAGILEGIDRSVVREMGLALAVIVAPVVFWSALPFYRGAWQAILARRPNLDVLVSTSIVVGYAASLWNTWRGVNETYYDSVAMLAGFLLAGRLVARLAEDRVRSGGEFLARELSGESSPAVPGEVVRVESGGTFPGDGTVRTGSGSMNAAWLTGEQEPVPLHPGAKVLAGGVNLDEAVEIEIETVGRDTRMGQILSMLSGVGKGRLQTASRRAEQGIVWGVLAVVGGLVARGVALGAVDGARIVAVLLVACPCAVGLAVPAILGVAHRQAAGRKILLKGVDAFERLAEIDTVVFDKTGTLTVPVPTLVAADWAVGESRESWSPVVGALCASSRHLGLRPIAGRFPETMALDGIREISGSGLECSRRGGSLRLGRRDWALEREDPSDGGDWTEIVLSVDRREVASFRLASTIRPEAASCVSLVSGACDVWILSGDRQGPVQAVAERLGIPEARALHRRTPEDKLEFVRDLERTRRVLFVGDGINDAAALRAAHVGIGVQGGAAVALASCDVYLAADDLTLLPRLLAASKAVRRNLFLALAWSVVWNIAGVALVLAGALGPVVCALLMPASSLFVVLYALTRKPFSVDKP